eukprot:2191344-Rhodomonas_salina.2
MAMAIAMAACVAAAHKHRHRHGHGRHLPFRARTPIRYRTRQHPPSKARQPASSPSTSTNTPSAPRTRRAADLAWSPSRAPRPSTLDARGPLPRRDICGLDSLGPVARFHRHPVDKHHRHPRAPAPAPAPAHAISVCRPQSVAALAPLPLRSAPRIPAQPPPLVACSPPRGACMHLSSLSSKRTWPVAPSNSSSRHAASTSAGTFSPAEFAFTLRSIANAAVHTASYLRTEHRRIKTQESLLLPGGGWAAGRPGWDEDGGMGGNGGGGRRPCGA